MSKITKKSSPANPEQYLHTDALKAGLAGRSIRGGTVTMLSQAAKFVMQFGSTVIVARLIAPEDFGLIAMVNGVTGFISMFKDMGLSMATVQKAEVTHRQVSNLFWINVVVSIIFALLTTLLAPVIAWFYKEPRLVLITCVAASGFVLGGLTTQHSALLNRQMRFTSLAAIDVAATLFGNLAAVLAALSGFGYWSLILMQLVIALSNAGGVWLMCGWRPGPPTRQVGTRSMLVFGRNLTGFNIVNYFSRNLDNILIGRYWGAQQLGLYDKAYQLLLLPLRQINIPISSVAVPGLSQLQLDPNRFRNYYLKTITCITFLTTPLIVLFLIIADEIVILALGPQWRDASVIFQLLAISAVVQPLLQTTGWLYVAMGRTDRQFKWGLLSAFILNSSFFIGLPFGARGVAFSYAIAMFLQTYPCLYYATRGTTITIPDIIGAVWKIVVSALLAGGATLATKLALMHQLLMLPAAILYSAVMGCAYLGILFYLFNTKDFYLSVFHGLKNRQV